MVLLAIKIYNPTVTSKLYNISSHICTFFPFQIAIHARGAYFENQFHL